MFFLILAIVALGPPTHAEAFSAFLQLTLAACAPVVFLRLWHLLTATSRRGASRTCQQCGLRAQTPATLCQRCGADTPIRPSVRFVAGTWLACIVWVAIAGGWFDYDAREIECYLLTVVYGLDYWHVSGEAALFAELRRLRLALGGVTALSGLLLIRVLCRRGVGATSAPRPAITDIVGRPSVL